MAKTLFKKIKNISGADVSINGVILSPNNFLFICKNPAFYSKFMSDITALYTKNLVSIYDSSNNIIASNDVWESIDYNVQISNIYANDVSITPAIIDESVTLSGYEKDIICNPTNNITLILPPVNSLDLYKTLNIKNLSNYVVTVIITGSDKIDNDSSSIQLTTLKSITIQPNGTLNSWILLSSPTVDNAVIFTQSTAQSIWGPIPNPYGRPCSVDVIDSVGNEFECDITHNADFTSIIINLSSPMSGKAILN